MPFCLELYVGLKIKHGNINASQDAVDLTFLPIPLKKGD